MFRFKNVKGYRMFGREVIDKAKGMVEDERSEIVELASKLIRFRTVAPPGETEECAQFVKSYFDEVGIETIIHERKPKKTNLCAKIPGGSEGTIIWLGHLDVVPAGSLENWSHDPFEGEVVGGRVYGRGSTDMKGSCASAMVAAKVLASLMERAEVKERLPTVEFWFTCDEEIGAVDGVRWLASEGLFKGDVCIIGDSFGSLPTDPWIDVGCKGYIRVLLRARGKTAHGSMPFMGENAIDKLVDAVGHVKRVEDYPLDLPEDMEPIAESSTQFLLGSLKLTKAQRKAAQRLFRYPTVSLNIISGGVRVNVVPDVAEAVLDIRITPGAPIWKVEQVIRNLLRSSEIKGVEMEITGLEEGFYEPLDSQVVQRMMEAVEVTLGTKPRPKVLTGTTDGIHIEHTSNIPCVGFGAGARGLAHAPDEYVTVENLVMAAKVYTVFPFIWAGKA